MGEEIYMHYPVSRNQIRYCPKCEQTILIILGKGKFCAVCGSPLQMSENATKVDEK